MTAVDLTLKTEAQLLQRLEQLDKIASKPEEPGVLFTDLFAEQLLVQKEVNRIFIELARRQVGL